MSQARAPRAPLEVHSAARLVAACTEDLPDGSVVLVACSGGADSLALAAAAAWAGRDHRLNFGAIVVDHNLQSGSAEQAIIAARQCEAFGLSPVEIMTVEVEQGPGSGGLESAARDARYAAFDEASRSTGAAAVLLAHTRDDQAESVLLGLARGSGSRSIKGMNKHNGLIRRPFLDLDRAATETICNAAGLEYYRDQHNEDERFARVRVRKNAMPALVDALGDAVPAALARTANQLQDDCDALDGWALTEFQTRWEPEDRTLDIVGADELPRAIVSRVLRLAILQGGSPAEEVTSSHIESVANLVKHWKGQGPVRVPGDREVSRVEQHLVMYNAGPITKE